MLPGTGVSEWWGGQRDYLLSASTRRSMSSSTLPVLGRSRLSGGRSARSWSDLRSARGPCHGVLGLLTLGLASLADHLLLGLPGQFGLLADGLLGLAGLLVREVAGRLGLLADETANGLGLLADDAGQHGRRLRPPEGEVTADVDRSLHELEVALDERDQVDLRQARRHVVS